MCLRNLFPHETQYALIKFQQVVNKRNKTYKPEQTFLQFTLSFRHLADTCSLYQRLYADNARLHNCFIVHTEYAN